MRIKALHFRNFRGLQSTGLPSCSGFNVLIGKNNAGKSSILAGLELVLEHLEKGRFSFQKPLPRPHDEFTHREHAKGFQIGLQLELNHELLGELKEPISSSMPSLEVAIAAIESEFLSILFDGLIIDGLLHTYISCIGFGVINADRANLTIEENLVLNVPRKTAIEVVKRDYEASRIISDLDDIDPALAEFPSWEYATRDQARAYGSRFRNMSIGGEKLLDAVRGLTSKAEFDVAVAEVKSELARRVEQLEQEEAPTAFAAFGGNVKIIPPYVYSILQTAAAKNVVHFRETRAAIGYEEAAQLLELKTRRGGAERLATVQSTVKLLLGVNVDAFEPEQAETRRTRMTARRQAEMDVDNFLVEANGAGIREALRIVLDIELKSPDVVLIEEPEVHLHPGLERSLHTYLVSKKEESQIFVSTHSTNFIDVSDIQSVFVLSRNKSNVAHIEQISSKEDLLRIPDEIGLRPSTILMFDRLIFVEGPSDEAIVSALFRRKGVDLLQLGTSFVKMGGSSALPHYAAEATLDLLSRRQIPMWFIIDRDEQSQEDIDKILARLGNRAQALSLQRRELENYLLDPEAIVQSLAEKAKHSEHVGAELPSIDVVSERLSQTALNLKDEVKRLTVERRVLRPVYPSRMEGNAMEKISGCAAHLAELRERAEREIADIHAEIDARWELDHMSLVPGSQVLEALYDSFGFKYDKTKDGRRLAEQMPENKISAELEDMVTSISRTR